jgi:pSer/pThr/pTyr-binding forkhead associated (FHA) protein
MAYAAASGALASYLEEFSVSLESLNGNGKGSRIKLESERITLGSGPGATLVLEAPGVAREHAVIEFWGAAYVLREIDAERPVTLNGSACRCRELRDGDRFQLGDLSFEFHCERLG